MLLSCERCSMLNRWDESMSCSCQPPIRSTAIVPFPSRPLGGASALSSGRNASLAHSHHHLVIDPSTRTILHGRAGCAGQRRASPQDRRSRGGSIFFKCPSSLASILLSLCCSYTCRSSCNEALHRITSILSCLIPSNPALPTSWASQCR